MSANTLHHDWLALIEISGPFLAVPVLTEAFPQGLEELDGIKRKRLRQAYEEWREAQETDDPQFGELHAAWIDEVLSRGLELDEDGKGDVLKRADWCAANLSVSLAEHGVTLAPDLAVIDEQRADKPLMLIHTYGQDVDLNATLKLDGFAATPAERMVQLCRATGCRLGLVTNGERWTLVDAPVGAVTTFASWYARIWVQEPITLQAFVHLLGIRRFFVDEAEQLPTLFDRSLKYQDEVTDALGEQVRRAVEVLIQVLDKADQDRDRELLRDVKEPELYEAALTVMMRLVFLLSAEERGLLLLGDERYEANYALSTLRMQLRKESEEILERRWDAWSRLLAIFRAVFGGIEHENLRLPALGGSLFDPDRFPFLEGRTKGSDWRINAAKPLPIDNRTVLLLLEAIQQFQGRTLSYRALDVEQIGYVYEGLLERTVKRTTEVTLELDCTKSAKSPWVKLAELESAKLDGAERLAELLQERSGSSVSRVRNDLAKPVDDTLADRLLAACHGDAGLRDRIKPFAHLVRTDPWGYPLIYPTGAFIVTTGSDRRETGTHYTPKSLTEAIVTETLTPITYVGPADGTPREQWVLKSPAELLDLKICDPAMGSGAFLVQACRWLADRLVEAWLQAEGSGKTVSVDGEVLDAPATKEPLPRDTEARTVIARRLIAERCLYGVDLNPLAVELAKLSIWLVTLAKGRPFGFLDHNLRCGDSLLGIHRLDQLTELSMTPTGKGQQRLFGQNIEQAVHEAIELRQQLRQMPIRDIRDVEAMARLDADARQKLEMPERIADAFIGEVLASGGNAVVFESQTATLIIQAGQAVAGDRNELANITKRASETLVVDLLPGRPDRNPLHWPLEFPEVFVRASAGFNAVIGNPPFLGGKKISTIFGDRYRKAVVAATANGRKGAADLCAYFLLRAHQILYKPSGTAGLLATDSICDGDNAAIGLGGLASDGAQLISAITSMPWPGKAGVSISTLCWVTADTHWRGRFALNGKDVKRIQWDFTTGDTSAKEIRSLKSNIVESFAGTNIHGDGFLITPDEAKELIAKNPRNSIIVKPYLNGSDVNTQVSQKPTRWVIDFGAMTRSSAEGFPECFDIVTQRVKPYRDTLTKQIHEPDYWKFWDKRLSSYAKIAKYEHVLVAARAAKDVQLTWVKNEGVFSDQLVVFITECSGVFAVLQSALHNVWAWDVCTGMWGSGIRYAPSKAVSTFPMPRQPDSLRDIGCRYYQNRREYEIKYQVGLTELYNRFHEPTNIDSGILRLRELHMEMNKLVLQAYGWEDVDLNHDFQELPYLPKSDRVRFTIGESARLEVLRRLSDLNQKRYEEELTEGLHGNAGRRVPRRPATVTPAQPSFDFDAEAAPTANSGAPATAILDFLSMRQGWHAKGDIVTATGIADSQWNILIAELISDGNVERQGERRGARYRFVKGRP